MTALTDFPVRARSPQPLGLRAAFDRLRDARDRHLRQLSSAAAQLGVAHLDRFELGRASLFESAAPERR